MEDNFCCARFIALSVFVVVVEPETEDQQEAAPHVEKKENVYVE
ncbi:MAG: hypothetical protein ACPGES_07200 [Coraliomargarita sp.]